MSKLTSERMNGIRTGYWSPAKKDELTQRLGMIEHKSERLIEQACELCHLPYVEQSQQALQEKCETCPLTILEKMIDGAYPEGM